MAVLSDQELWALIGSGRLVIDPSPQLNAVSPSTIDLTLDNDFRVPHAGGGAAAEVVIDTRERIGLPSFLAARIEGRSTLARLGLSVHQSAPTVHPTFHGQLQLELTNAGPYTLRLYPGQAICQLAVETMSLPAVATLDSVHQRSGG